MKKTTDIDQLCINTIRPLSLDAVQKANSGAVLLALESIGRIESTDGIPFIESKVFMHDVMRQNAYEQAKEKQRKYYELMS